MDDKSIDPNLVKIIMELMIRVSALEKVVLDKNLVSETDLSNCIKDSSENLVNVIEKHIKGDNNE